MKKKLLALCLIFSFMATTGFGCKGGTKEAKQMMTPITINYWGVWNDSEDMSVLINAYNKIHPNITIKYRKLSYEEYEQELVNALAEDRGPDIFSVNSTWLRKYSTKITPMPAQIRMAYPVEKGTIQKEVVPEIRVSKSISLTGLKNNFLDTVYKDVVLDYYNETTKTKEKKIYGLPLSVDTMVMFYNKDLLNNANIGELSPYWNKRFQQDVKKLTKQNAQGEIVQAGIALGAGSNIEKSSDIMAAIIMQNGGTVLDESGRVAITATYKDKNYIPGIDAIRFYSDFSNPTKDVYSWNTKLDNSLKMFMEGRLAIMFGYGYHVPIIKAQAPKLNFGVKKMVQVEGSTNVKNVADYWVETVSKKSKYSAEAWDFIQYITTQKDIVKPYLDKANKLTALRSLVEDQIADSERGLYAEQLLSSYNWYQGYDYPTADKSLKEMADNIANKQDDIEHEIRLGEEKVRQTLNAPSSN